MASSSASARAVPDTYLVAGTTKEMVQPLSNATSMSSL